MKRMIITLIALTSMSALNTMLAEQVQQWSDFPVELTDQGADSPDESADPGDSYPVEQYYPSDSPDESADPGDSYPVEQYYPADSPDESADPGDSYPVEQYYPSDSSVELADPGDSYPVEQYYPSDSSVELAEPAEPAEQAYNTEEFEKGAVVCQIIWHEGEGWPVLSERLEKQRWFTIYVKNYCDQSTQEKACGTREGYANPRLCKLFTSKAEQDKFMKESPKLGADMYMSDLLATLTPGRLA